MERTRTSNRYFATRRVWVHFCWDYRESEWAQGSFTVGLCPGHTLHPSPLHRESWGPLLYIQAFRDDVSDEVPFEQRPEERERMNHATLWGLQQAQRLRTECGWYVQGMARNQVTKAEEEKGIQELIRWEEQQVPRWGTNTWTLEVCSTCFCLVPPH